jgi:predicted RND superfamily exporter protein
MEQKELLEFEFKKASDRIWKRIERKLDKLEYQIEEQPRFLAVEKGNSPWKMETPFETDYNPTHSKWIKSLNVLMPVEKKETYNQGRFKISYVEDSIEKKSKLDLEQIRIEMQPKMVETYIQTGFKYQPTHSKWVRNLNLLMQVEDDLTKTQIG